jgi:acyl-CoA thioesterase FadM
VRAWREFEIVSPLGEKLLEAASVWLIVDLQNRRPVRLPRFLLELEFPPRITAVDFAPVPERPEAAPRVARRTVSPEDLDINNHANNAAYLAWAEAEAEKDSPCSLQVDFLDEALLGEEIRVETWEQAEQGVIQLIMGARGVCACVQWWRGGQEV